MSQQGSVWTEYVVGWHFPNRLCGGVPQDPDIVAKWLRARMPSAKPPEAREIAEIQEEVLQTLSAPTEEREIGVNSFRKIAGRLVGFPEEPSVLAIRAADFRSHFKDCARVVSRYIAGRVKGEAAFSTRFINCVYPDGPEQYWVPILRDGKALTTEDAWEEKPFTAMTRMGPISAFKRTGYVEEVNLYFRLWVAGGAVPMADIQKVMWYGGTHGFGGERGVGHGRYLVTLLREGPVADDQPEFWWTRTRKSAEPEKVTR